MSIEASLNSDFTGAAVVQRSSISERPLLGFALFRLVRSNSGIKPPSGSCSSANGARPIASTVILDTAAGPADVAASGGSVACGRSTSTSWASCSLLSTRPGSAALYLGQPAICALISACRQTEPPLWRSFGSATNSPVAKLDTSANRACDEVQL